MFTMINNIWKWLYSKRNEVAQLQYRDLLMAQIVMEIMNVNDGNGFEYLPLDSLRQLHPVDNREDTIASTELRSKTIERKRKALIKKKRLSKEDVAELMPSVTYMRAIPAKDGYIVFEGNGRLVALQNVLSGHGVLVELDVYRPTRHAAILRKIKRLSRYY
ncbi:hypothetical protein HOI83_00970 [Candidatus Uhrbacteria bacterium]|jgi:hypothetical protein|nr:hypothetical protein [Candidatus Uhrbacteria bacterium]